MLYNILKILHIFSASLFLLGIVTCIFAWKYNAENKTVLLNKIQIKTLFYIMPLAIIQLTTGFTIISLKHYSFREHWVQGSVLGFIIMIASWFVFLILLSLGNHKRTEKGIIVLCLSTILLMVFMMANKIV